MNRHNTHLLQDLPTKGRSSLARLSSGQVIAYRQGAKIMFGENPAALECREFISEDHAMQALRHIASVDQAQRMGKVCKDCGMPPAEVAVCPAASDGAHRTEMRSVAEIETVNADPQVVRVH